MNNDPKVTLQNISNTLDKLIKPPSLPVPKPPILTKESEVKNA